MYIGGWEARWVISQNKKREGKQGAFGWTAGKYYADAEEDKGLQTTQDQRFYQISAGFPKYSKQNKDIIFQFSVKHEQAIDCGGAYLKILPGPMDQSNFNGETPYKYVFVNWHSDISSVMFGPDICGLTKKTHLIINYKGEYYLVKKEITAEKDDLTHLYTLIVRSDDTYEVKIDGKEVASGNLKEDFGLPPDTVDPNVYLFENSQYVGLEVFQAQAGTIFDNIIITEDTGRADKLAELAKKTQAAEVKTKRS